MKSRKNPADLSYFRLLMVAFLRESHPDRAADESLIGARVEAALYACENAVLNGCNPLQAEHEANETLFEGLHFSKFDTLKNVLWNEFFNEIPEDDAPELAKRLLPEFESIFAQYKLTDDFAYLPEYEVLYTELTGAVALYLQSDGI